MMLLGMNCFLLSCTLCNNSPYRLYPDMLPQAQQEECASSNNKDLTDKEMQESIVALSDYLTAMRPRVRDSKVLCI